MSADYGRNVCETYSRLHIRYFLTLRSDGINDHRQSRDHFKTKYVFSRLMRGVLDYIARWLLKLDVCPCPYNDVMFHV